MSTTTANSRFNEPVSTDKQKTASFNSNFTRLDAGRTLPAIAGAAVAAYQCVYVDSNAKIQLATDSILNPRFVIPSDGGAAQNATAYAQFEGIMTNSGWAWTIGGLIYCSAATAGLLTQTRPTTSSQPVAQALTATSIMLLPYGVLMPGLVNGGVLFGGSAGNITSDDPNFHWDPTNKRLKITSAGQQLRLIGTIGGLTYAYIDSVTAAGKLWRVGQSGAAGASLTSFDVYNETDMVLALSLTNAGALSIAATAQTGAVNRFRMLQSMARVHQNVAQGPIANSAQVGLNLNVADFNTDGMWTASNGYLVAPIAGKYLLVGGVGFTAAGAFRLSFSINGGGFGGSGAGSYGGPYGSISDTKILNANDQVQLLILNSSGGSLTTTGDNTNYLGMLYVGE